MVVKYDYRRWGRALSKDIAILMGSINMDNQKRIMEGMIDAAKETANNVYLFTNYSGRRENKETVQGAFHIMELPDFEYFDGIIVALNTISHLPTASYIMDKLRASEKPVITLDRKVEGYGCLLSSSYDSQYKVIEHMIQVHNCRDIVYLRGPMESEEAEIRFCAYKDVLKEHQIVFDETKVFYGDFSLKSGKRIAKEIYNSDRKPDAIICGNDSMAVGVLQYCMEHDIQVPQDVRITGFDNIESSEYSYPSITTVDKNPYELGYRAIYEMLAAMEGKAPTCDTVWANPVYRMSCGCREQEETDIRRLKYRYVEKGFYARELSTLINSTLAEFSGLQKPEDILPIMRKSVQDTGLKAFYLCLCERDKVYVLPETNMGGNFELLQVNTEYTERMELPLAYENGEISSYHSFPKGMVLPKKVREEARKIGGNYYVITPINFQNCCYGYCVSGNEKLILKNDLYYSWLMNIGVAYENIRKWMLLQDAIVRLNNVWSYDALTQLYNRAGFFYEAKTILEILKLQNSKIFVLFSDVDGLKEVNDTQGHEAGDTLIKAMADCFKENLTCDMLAMRYGGDEFVIFGSYDEEEEIQYLIEGIHASIDRRNFSKKYSFTLSTSIGVSTYRAKEVEELSDLIEVADMKMYEQKRQKREERQRLGKIKKETK